MHILHINSEKEVGKVDEFIKKGSDVFILIYMEGCGPCNATRPEWAKIESALKDQYSKNNKLVVIDINKDNLSKIKQPFKGQSTSWSDFYLNMALEMAENVAKSKIGTIAANRGLLDFTGDSESIKNLNDNLKFSFFDIHTPPNNSMSEKSINHSTKITYFKNSY